MSNETYTRGFSYGSPVGYQGYRYPSTMMDIEDENGNVASRQVFADANGQYYSLDANGNAVPVILQNSLDEVVVKPNWDRAAASPELGNLLTKQFNDWIAASNDNTQVLDIPHSEYNANLRDRALKGAEDNALWEREHPNATAWRNTAEALPFAVAAAPVASAAVAAGDALAATSAGEAIGSGLGMAATTASNSTWLPWLNTLASSYFAANGLQDIKNGEFTPETAMDLMPLAQLGKPMYKAGKELYSVAKDMGYSVPEVQFPTRDVEAIDVSDAFSGFGSGRVIQLPDRIYPDPLTMHFSRAKAKGYDPNKVQILNIDKITPELNSHIQRLAQQRGENPLTTYWKLQKFIRESGNAVGEFGNNLVLYNSNLPKTNYSTVFSHELEHALHTPSTPLPVGIMDPNFMKSLKGYFMDANNSEIAARGSQIRDWLGQTGTELLTAEDLQRASNNYVKDTGMDNNMTDFFNAIRDYKGLAKWLSKEATGIVPTAIVGSELYKSKTE